MANRNAYQREWRERNFEKVHAREVFNRQKPDNKARKRKYQKAYYAANKNKIAAQRRAWRDKNRDKERARDRYKYALQSGKLVSMPCEVCGEKKVHGHHTDYSKPLSVKWLCSIHHMEQHRKLGT